MSNPNDPRTLDSALGMIWGMRAEIDRLRAELAELHSPSALGNLLHECGRLRSALDAIRRHSDKDTDAHQLALEALEH